MLKLDVSSDSVSYSLLLESKITVIRGDSGVGKTTLIDLIDAVGNGAVSLKLSDTRYTPLVLRTKDWASLMTTNQYNRCVYFLDDRDCIVTDAFAKMVQMDECSFFVIANRKTDLRELTDTWGRGVSPLKGLIYGTYSVKRLQTGTDGISRFAPYYAFSINSSEHPNKVVTEDSKSGYAFFHSINSLTESLNGNGNIESYLSNCVSGDVVALLVDLAVLGGVADAIFATALSRKCDVCMCSEYRSFEYMLLRSNLLKPLLDYRKDVTNDMICKEPTDERLATEVLKQVVVNTPISYNKGDTQLICFLEDCCANHSREEPCPVGLAGNKLDELFKGTEFETLIEFLRQDT